MKCGHCQSRDVTVSHVRTCASPTRQPVVPAREAVYSGCGGSARAVTIPARTMALVGTSGPSWDTVGAAVRTESHVSRETSTYPHLDEHAGMYRDPRNGSIYKVQKAVHGSGHLYAKSLVVHGPGSAEFQMAPGMVRKIKLDWRMTVDEARTYGALYGVCVRCGRTLTDETSIAEGIGPICASKI